MSLFENTSIKVYGDELLSEESVEYGQVTFEFESFDLGEPIKGKEEINHGDQEQIAPDIINHDGSIDEAVDTNINEPEAYSQEYDVPEETASTIEDLSSDEINEVVINTSESHVMSDDVIDDYDMDDQFRDF